MKLKRYLDLSADDLNVEYQVHTIQTDGQSTIAEILKTAKARGLKAIAFTEHVRRDTTWFPKFSADVCAAAQDYGNLEVYVGCEAKVLDSKGTLDISDDIRARCDIVLGSVHRFPAEKGGYINWDQLEDAAFACVEYELALGLLQNAQIDVLAHPGGMFERRRNQSFPEAYLRNLMMVSVETGVAIEINTSYLRDVDGFLKLCAEINPYVSIGSDAHTLVDIGQCRDVLRSKKGGHA